MTQDITIREDLVRLEGSFRELRAEVQGEARATNLAIQELSKNVDRLVKNWDKHGNVKIPWAQICTLVISAMVAVSTGLAYVGSLAIEPIKNDIKRLERRHDQ